MRPTDHYCQPGSSLVTVPRGRGYQAMAGVGSGGGTWGGDPGQRGPGKMGTRGWTWFLGEGPGTESLELIILNNFSGLWGVT